MSLGTFSRDGPLLGPRDTHVAQGAASFSMWIPVALGRSILLGMVQSPLVSPGAWIASSSLTQSGCIPTRLSTTFHLHGAPRLASGPSYVKGPLWICKAACHYLQDTVWPSE